MKKGFFLILLLLASLSLQAQKPVKDIGIALRLNDFTHLFVRNDIIAMNATLWLKWQSFKTSEHDRYFYDDQVDEQLNKMWWPRYRIPYSRGKINKDNQTLLIKADGEVVYQSKLSFSIEAALDFTRFPFDYQTLDLKIEPAEPSAYQTRYYLMKTKAEGNQTPPMIEWRELGKSHQLIGKDKNIYQLKIQYQRKYDYYLFKVFLPMLMILMISYLLFWIHQQAAITRLSVIVTSLLTLVAFEWTFNDTIPRVSYITYIQAMIVYALIMISSIGLMVVIAEQLSEHGKNKVMRYARMLYPLILAGGIILISIIWL